MGSVFTCKLNPCCGDRYNCEPPQQYYEDEPAAAPVVPQAQPAEVSELVERLNAACDGHPNAEIPWPHRLLHDAAALLSSTSERLKAVEAELDRRNEELGLVIMACPQGMRTSPASDGVKQLRDAKERAEAALAGARAALRQIGGGNFHGASNLAANGQWHEFVDMLQAIARAALTQGADMP